MSGTSLQKRRRRLCTVLENTIASNIRPNTILEREKFTRLDIRDDERMVNSRDVRNCILCVMLRSRNSSFQHSLL